MDEYIRSRHKLTFSPASSPLVLLDYGQWIAADLAFQLACSFEVIPLIDTAAPFIRDSSVRSYLLTLTTFTTEALDKDALVAAMNSLLTVQGKTKAPLRVEIEGHSGHYWQFASSAITAHAPVRVVKSAVARWSRTYNITASGLSYT